MQPTTSLNHVVSPSTKIEVGARRLLSGVEALTQEQARLVLALKQLADEGHGDARWLLWAWTPERFSPRQAQRIESYLGLAGRDICVALAHSMESSVPKECLMRSASAEAEEVAFEVNRVDRSIAWAYCEPLAAA